MTAEPDGGIDRRLAALLHAAGIEGDFTVLARLGAGQHHLTFQLSTTRGLLVARLPGAVSAPAGRLAAESTVQQVAAAVGLTPPRLWDDPVTGASLSPWREGAPLAPEVLRRPEVAAEVGALIGRLQALPLDVPGPDLEQAARDYAARLESAGVPGVAAATRDRRLARLTALAEASQPRVNEARPAHGDLVANNLLRTPTGLQLIDWEYAGLAHPWWDPATVVSLHALPPPAVRGLLAAAGMDPAVAESPAFARMVELVALLAWAWAGAEAAARPGDPRPRAWLDTIEARLWDHDRGHRQGPGPEH
ncbi:MAG: phosphotransferase [Gammaproteobacteria bacterium]|nr:phosphotransferase [Gammaproteobacteria bacterium]